MTREEAVRHLDGVVTTFINDRCVNNEHEEERLLFRQALSALGVTDEEIEAWA